MGWSSLGSAARKFPNQEVKISLEQLLEQTRHISYIYSDGVGKGIAAIGAIGTMYAP